MKPKNTAERKKAFWNFLLLFLLSTTVIVLLAFSSTRVPIKQNAMLQKQVNIMDHEHEFQSNFITQMKGIMTLLDTVNSRSSDANVVDAQITADLPRLSVMVNTDSIDNKDLYVNAVYVLTQLQSVKRQLRINTTGTGDINECRRQIETLNNQLEQVKAQRDQYQVQLVQALKQ